MGEKDIAENILLNREDVFADIHNVLYFGGKQVIRPEDLVPHTGTSAYTGKGKLRKRERDVVKFWKPANAYLALFGIENQTRPDADIALRVINYDGMAYRDQLQNETQKMRYPVLSTVLYFGYTHWRAARSLKERLTIPPELVPFINDYKVNVIEVAFLAQKQADRFQSDFRSVADYFINSRLDRDYKGSREQITHVVEFFQLMKVLTGDRRFDDMDFDTLPQGGSSMFSIIDRAENRGLVRGRAEGIITGRAEGIITGRAEGIITGRAEGANRMAEKMDQNIQALLESKQITEEAAALLRAGLKNN